MCLNLTSLSFASLHETKYLENLETINLENTNVYYNNYKVVKAFKKIYIAGCVKFDDKNLKQYL